MSQIFSCVFRRLPPCHLLVTAVVLAGFLPRSAQADPLYWDGTGTGWDAVGGWSTVQNNSTPDPANIPGAGDIATFGATTAVTAQTVNLNGDQSALGLATNASNTFLTTLLGGGTDRTLNLGVSGIGHLFGGLTIGSATAGQMVNISLQGGQTWTSSAPTAAPGAGLKILNGVSIGAGGNQTLTLAGVTGTLGGEIQGSVTDGAAVLSISKTDTGNWTLSGANSFTGTTTVSAGNLIISNNTALGTTAGNTSVSAGAGLALSGGITVTGETLSLTGSSGSNGGALRSLTGNNLWTGNITAGVNATTRISSESNSGFLTITGNILMSTTATDQFVLQGIANGTGGGLISGNITGNSRLTRGSVGSGVWTLSGNNDYAQGTAISAGTLQFAKRVSLYSANNAKWVAANASGTTAGLYVAGTATLGLNVGGADEFTATDLEILLNGSHLGASTGTTGMQSNATLALDTTNAAGGLFTYSTGLTNNGANVLQLRKTGVNALELAGANTYTGATTVAAGTLVISGTLAATAVSVSNSATLQLRNAAALSSATLSTGISTLQLRGDANDTFTTSGAISVAGTTTIDVDQLAAGANQTLTLGAVNLTVATSSTLNVTGGNGYGLALGAVTQTSVTGATITVNNTAPLSIASYTTLSNAVLATLLFNGSGTATLTGNITQSGTAPLALTRSTSAAGVLILQGSSNMTGAVTISAGTIQTAVTNAFGSTSGISIGATGVLALRHDTSATFGNGVTAAPVTVTASGATINVDRATVAGTGQTLTLGTVAIGGGYTLNVTGANNTSLTLGAIAGTSNSSKTINNNITGGGVLTIASYTESAVDTRTLIFGGTGNTGVTGVISGVGPLNLTYSGTGTLTLGGASTYTGVTTIGSGTISASDINSSDGSSNIGNASSAVVLGVAAISKGTLSYTGNTATYTRGLTVTTGGGEVDVTTAGQVLTIGTGNVVISTSGVFTVGGAGDTTINSVVSGGGRIVKNDAGTLVLAGANTFSGGLTVNAGTVTLAGSNSSSGGLTLNAGTVNVNSVNGHGNGALTINGGVLDNTSGGAVAMGNNFAKTINASFDFGNASSTSLNDLTLGLLGDGASAAISITADVSISVGGASTLIIAGTSLAGGTNDLVKLGTGTLAFGNNFNLAFSGTLGDVTVSEGTLVLGSNGGSPLLTLGNTQVASGATWALSTGNASTPAIINVNALSGAGTITSDNTMTSGAARRYLTVGVGDGSAIFSGNIVAGSEGSIALGKSGSGTQVLSGINTYTGNTVVNAGTLQFARKASFYNGDATKWLARASTVTSATLAGIHVASGATLALNVGGTDEFSSSDLTTLLNSTHLGASTATTGLVSGAILGLDTTNAAGGVFSYGLISNTNAGANALGLAKLGSNILELTAVNTYTGPTTVLAGTLQVGVGGTGSTNAASTVTVNGTTASLAGTGTVNGATLVTSGSIRPGDAGGSSVGTLTLGSLEVQEGGSAVIQIDDNGDNDLVDVQDTLVFSGSLLVDASFALEDYDTVFAVNSTFDLLDWTGAFGGTFDVGNNFRTGGDDNGLQFDLPDLTSVSRYWDVSNFLTDGTIMVVAVPEPSRTVLLFGGMAAWLLRRRRRSC